MGEECGKGGVLFGVADLDCNEGCWEPACRFSS